MPAKLSINPLTIQIATIVIAGVLIVWVAVLANRTTNSRSTQSLNSAHAAYTAARMDAQRHNIEGIYDRLATGQSLDATTALNAFEEMQALSAGARDLTQTAPGTRSRTIAALATSAESSMRTYFRTGARADLDRSADLFKTLDASIETMQEEMNAQSFREQDALTSSSRLSLVVILAAVTASTAILGFLSLIIGRRQRRSLEETRMERDQLAEVTRTIRKRNDQFNALYQVVNEVTDSLSMRYVVHTTVTEAAHLVDADHVRFRQLEGDSLVVTGSWSANPDLEERTFELPLGVGVAGRAAKRGKTIRIDSDAEAQMADGEKVHGAQSGLVVPLIVGARVLGTLACWSLQPSKFDADDERVLEMMAAQVASAVAAADLHQTSEKKAAHDALTGLPNRRGLIEDTESLRSAAAGGEQIAVVMLDIDHFKRFNDDFGHRVGDVTLQKVAEVMRGSLRETDQLYRYGGEEFLLILHGAGESDAYKLTDRLRAAVERAPLTGESLEPVGPVTVSAGIALCPANGTDFDELVVLADDALYQSKANGRNRVTVFQAPGPALITTAV